MFGVDFSELGLVFIVALIVLGPTRLPGLVRKVGLWAGRARSMARQFREQLESEVNLEELTRTAKAKPTPAPAAASPAYPPPPPEFGGEPMKPADGGAGAAGSATPADGNAAAGDAPAAAASAEPAVDLTATPPSAYVYTPEAEAASMAAEPEYIIPSPDDPSHNDASEAVTVDSPPTQDSPHEQVH
ncbi:MAG: Sec-independent protein translocase protein TatB [Nevskiaceae bacterium]|jgi:sec-independent protein translocase protein TatB|nr:Sec-independent protein translocase protein TatB [Nevskiaceae bacterium]